MTAAWEIDESAPPVAPPADSVEGDDAAGELTAEDLEAISSGVELPADAEGSA